jgi:hypothetical protein
VRVNDERGLNAIPPGITTSLENLKDFQLLYLMVCSYRAVCAMEKRKFAFGGSGYVDRFSLNSQMKFLMR